MGAAVRAAEKAVRRAGAMTYRGAALRRSPAFLTSGHFVPKPVIIGILACVRELRYNDNIGGSNRTFADRR